MSNTNPAIGFKEMKTRLAKTTALHDSRYDTKKRTRYLLALLLMLLFSCGKDSPVAPIQDPQEPQDPEPRIYKIPVVVHVIHLGEAIGEGHNLSTARIEGQIRTLNEDFRRKEGTRGFNSHPDGGDARIEFVLAKSAPDGAETEGIVRINASAKDNPTDPQSLFDYYAHYSYWDPEKYLNVWTMPLSEAKDVLLGMSTGPETELPGAELFVPGEPLQAEGILINSVHFGESGIDSEYNLGRTLTHEVGHYLGLLHTWGGGDCEANDYCDDTPPVSAAVGGCPAEPPPACDGQPVMIENYMNYTFDRCMNIFTNDQIARMHHVLQNSPRRKTLLDSPGLKQHSVSVLMLNDRV